MRTIATSVCGYLLLLIVLPLGAIVQQAFAGGWGPFTQALTNPVGLAALRLTVETALLAAVINTVAGTMIAFELVRHPLPGKSLLNALVDLPLAIPTTVSGLMLLLLYAPNANIGAWFAAHGMRLMYSPTGIVLALVFVTFPYVVRSVQPLLEQMDPSVEEAARTLQASHLRIVREILLPTVRPGILTGFTLTFGRALAEFGSVVMVAGNVPMRTQVAPVYLYGLLENDNPQGAAAVSVVLLFISLLALLIQVYVSRRFPRPTLTWMRRWRRSSVERRSADESPHWIV
jgi:sulfate transport system permease protein